MHRLRLSNLLAAAGLALAVLAATPLAHGGAGIIAI